MAWALLGRGGGSVVAQRSSTGPRQQQHRPWRAAAAGSATRAPRPGHRRAAPAAAAASAAAAAAETLLAWQTGEGDNSPSDGGRPTLPRELPPAALVARAAALAAAAASDAAARDALADALPKSAWLLELRAAAAAQLPSFGAERLCALVAALGALPLQAENSPLPIGFGTPRWALPRAVADPDAWEDFLAAAAEAFADALVGDLEAAGALPRPGAPGPAAGGSDPEVAAAEAAAQRARALAARFAVALASAKKWAMARVDDEWAGSAACAAAVGAFAEAHWPGLLAELATLAEGAGGAGGGGEPHRQRGPGEEAAARARRRQRRALCAFLARAQLQHRLAPPAALLDLFYHYPPAVPAAAAAPAGAAAATTGSRGPAGASAAGEPAAPAGACQHAYAYTLGDLEAIVRTSMLIGTSPSEPWLAGLVAAVAAAREGMEAQRLRGFVEGFRFFRTQHSGSKRLRDAIAALSEWL